MMKKLIYEPLELLCINFYMANFLLNPHPLYLYMNQYNFQMIFGKIVNKFKFQKKQKIYSINC